MRRTSAKRASKVSRSRNRGPIKAAKILKVMTKTETSKGLVTVLRLSPKRDTLMVTASPATIRALANLALELAKMDDQSTLAKTGAKARALLTLLTQTLKIYTSGNSAFLVPQR